MKLQAIPAPVALRSSMPTATVQIHTVIPVGATAIRISFSAVSVPGDPFDVRLDNLLLAPTIFADGFETANTNRLSATVP